MTRRRDSGQESSVDTSYLLFLADVLAISILAFVLYVPRHRRKDLVVALVVVNVGVLAVTTALALSTVNAGLGLGLFGVLSIIRLRSTELSQHEVAYYFAALAIGLVGGMRTMDLWLGIALIAAIVLALAIVDSPRVLRSSRQLTITVDRAIANQDELIAYIEQQTGYDVREVSIQRLDYVDDCTWVDARCSERTERVRGTGASAITSRYSSIVSAPSSLGGAQNICVAANSGTSNAHGRVQAEQRFQ
ncbi:DUF4956 domain-containing protein [Actinobaculum sp. 352]|nr:DUF4956 domain-containing protein [Actinobaculum sp. 352]